MTSIAELEAQKQKIHATFSKADAALYQGKITQQEHDILLNTYFSTTDERTATETIDRELEYQRLRTEPEPRISKATMLIIGFSLVVMTLFATLFYSTGGITGAAVLERPVNATYLSNATLQLELDAATRINITGLAEGDGDIAIILLENNQRHELYSFRHGSVQTPHASMPKSRYIAGETVAFTATSLSSAYLMTGEEAIPLDNTTIEGLAPGEYTIKLIINDTSSNITENEAGAMSNSTTTAAGLTQEALSFTVAEPGTSAPEEQFNTCGSACNVNITGNASLEIIIAGEAALELDSIIISTKENKEPQLIQQIPDATGNGTVLINLSGHFLDPDGDTLYFDSTHHEGMAESIGNGIFTVSGAAGTYTYIIYASDLRGLTPSNIFSITITADETADANASTANETPSITQPPNHAINISSSLNETSNQTTLGIESGDEAGGIAQNASSKSEAAGCDNPDPNLRPLSCIQGDGSTYFKPETIILENKNAAAVGQLTPVGNLLIRGGLIEDSTGQPAAIDYSLGHTDENGDFVATVWIDTASGDLHLRGHLTEANGNIHMEDGWSAVANKRGIVLALINRQTGDLIVRGNLVLYRRSIG